MSILTNQSHSPYAYSPPQHDHVDVVTVGDFSRGGLGGSGTIIMDF